MEKKLLFKGIVGSQAYGLNTPTSDVDYKSVYLQSDTDILSNSYVPQEDINKDYVSYELRRFLELLAKGNPNVLELLYLPEDCVLKTTPEWKFLVKNRDLFLSKDCYNTYSGYAKTQLSKASGLNKKFNWESKRLERKNLLHFSNILDRGTGKTHLLVDWLKLKGLKESHIGITAMDGFRDGYKLYLGDYGGIGAEKGSNAPKKAIVTKKNINEWKGYMYFNRELYSKHCKDYNQYLKWLKNRNEDRVATNKKHGQSYDGKNIMHTVRLIMTGSEIPTEGKINIKRMEERDFLLDIKRGNVDLKNIIEIWSKKVDDMKILYDESSLKDEVDLNMIKEFELKIRRNEI